MKSPSLTCSRLFIYLGFALIVVAFVTFPTRVLLHAQPADTDYYRIGWLFSPIIGMWGLTSAVLGIVQSSMQTEKTKTCLWILMGLVFVALGFSGWMAISFGIGGAGNPFWLVYFAMVLIPSSIIYVASYSFFKNKDKIKAAFSSKKRIFMIFSILIIVPLVYTVALLALLL